ncbi:MAG: ATP synthase F1 subunit gamma [Candidatus Bipolaricaulota bacterium]
MPQAREVKGRIANIKDIRQITKAMSAIAMAKVTRMKEALQNARPYHEQVEQAFRLLAEPSDSPNSPLVDPNPEGATGVVVFNSDRGLCGRYKEELNRSTRDFINSRTEKVRLYAGGEKSYNFFRHWNELADSWTHFYDDPNYSQAVQIAREFAEEFRSGTLSELWVVYMEFHSDLNQTLHVDKLLPFELEDEGGKEASEDVLYEPDKETILEKFLLRVLEDQLFWIILHTKTSEHAIRRKAMRDATDNADDLIHDLTLEFNKARQQQITREISDIMGGAEALREA